MIRHLIGGLVKNGLGVLKNKERHWFWAMARCCWAHLVLQVRSFGPQRNFGSGGLLPARHAGGLQGCAISAYKLLPFRPPSISFPSRSSLQARPGDDGPPLLVQRSATYHIISFRLVGRVKLPHQAPARETSCRQRSTAYRAISTSSSIHGGAAAHGETNLPARSQFHRTSTL